jgi:hypothetical protein
VRARRTRRCSRIRRTTTPISAATINGSLDGSSFRFFAMRLSDNGKCVQRHPTPPTPKWGDLAIRLVRRHGAGPAGLAIQLVRRHGAGPAGPGIPRSVLFGQAGRRPGLLSMFKKVMATSVGVGRGATHPAEAFGTKTSREAASLAGR